MLDGNGDVDLNLTEFSGRSVATPALYRAMDNLLKKYGTMTDVVAAVSATHGGALFGRTVDKVLLGEQALVFIDNGHHFIGSLPGGCERADGIPVCEAGTGRIRAEKERGAAGI